MTPENNSQLCPACEGKGLDPACREETCMVCGGSGQVTGEAAPAEGVKDAMLGRLLTKLPTLDPAWSDEVRDGWMRCFNALRELAASPSMGAQRGSAAPEPRQLTDSRCDYFAFEGRICNKCGRNHDGLGKPIWEGVRGSAALTDEQIVKTAVQVFGKYAYEARSLFIQNARTLLSHPAAPDAERAFTSPLPSLSEPHSVHLAAPQNAEDFRRRPASSEAAPSADDAQWLDLERVRRGE